MNKYSKVIIKFLVVLMGLCALGYGAYTLYHYVIEDATQRIQQGVAKGVSKGIGGVLNPLKW